MSDCDNPTNGPNGMGCQHGGGCIDGIPYDHNFTCNCTNTGFHGTICVDIIPFDGQFICNCTGTGFVGDNCDITGKSS